MPSSIAVQTIMAIGLIFDMEFASAIEDFRLSICLQLVINP